MAPERWLVLSVRPSGEDAAADVTEILVDLGGAAVEETAEGWLTTYLPPPDDPQALADSVRATIEGEIGGSVEVRWRWQAHEDWAETWKRGLGPRRVGDRIVVAPSWTTPDVRDGDIVVVVDPQMAFGTGEHATTRGALRLLEKSVRPGDRVLDVGTGTGILAMAAARLGARSVLGLEIDAEAVETARANVERNGVDDRVEVRQQAVDPDYLAALGTNRFELVTGNVLSGVLVPLLPGFRDVLVPGGHAILGGILDTEAERVRRTAAAQGFRVVEEDREEEWWNVLLSSPADFDA